MKLIDMKVELIKIPLKKPFRIAFAVQDHSVNVLVKLITDEGIWGIGEAAPFEPVTGENANTVLEVLKLFKQGLLGPGPMDLEGIHQMMVTSSAATPPPRPRWTSPCTTSWARPWASPCTRCWGAAGTRSSPT